MLKSTNLVESVCPSVNFRFLDFKFLSYVGLEVMIKNANL